MQQRLCSRGSGSFLVERNTQACGAVAESVTSCDFPFCCPRCGKQEHFRSLETLRAQLEFCHSYCSPDAITGSFSITGKLPDSASAAIPWHDSSLPARRGQQSASRPLHMRSLSDSRDSSYLQSYSSVRRRRTQSVGTQAEEEEGGSEDEDLEEEEGERNESGNDEDVKSFSKKSDPSQQHLLNHGHFPFPPPTPHEPPPDQDQDPGAIVDSGSGSRLIPPSNPTSL